MRLIFLYEPLSFSERSCDQNQKKLETLLETRKILAARFGQRNSLMSGEKIDRTQLTFNERRQRFVARRRVVFGALFGTFVLNTVAKRALSVSGWFLFCCGYLCCICWVLLKLFVLVSKRPKQLHVDRFERNSPHRVSNVGPTTDSTYACAHSYLQTN